MKLTLQTAEKMIDAALHKAAAQDLKAVVAVVDEGGHLLAQKRMDDAPIASIEISLNKAFSAVVMQEATGEYALHCQPGGPIYGIHNMYNGRLVIFEGGFPIASEDRIIGGIGVSGGSAEQDRLCAEAGLAAL